MAEYVLKALKSFFEGLVDNKIGFYSLYDVYKKKQTVSKQDTVIKQHRPLTVLASRRPLDKPSIKKEVKSDANEPKLIRRVWECALLNGGIFWLSVFIFESIYVPTLRWVTLFILGDVDTFTNMWSWLEPTISYMFNTLWVLPLFVISKVVNSLWFQDIANEAFKNSGKSTRLPAFHIFVADICFSLSVQTIFLIQSTVVAWVPLPFIGQGFGLIHLALLFSLYAFEYKWLNLGKTIDDRMKLLEDQWPYFLGFGLPLALGTWYPSNMFYSSAVFAIFFPVMIISADAAKESKVNFDFPLRLFGFAWKVTDFFMRQSKRFETKSKS